MTMPKVADVRLTLLWTETNLTLLNDPAPKGAPLVDLGRDALYARLFESMRDANSKASAMKLTVPWKEPSKAQRFWRSYLNISRGRTLDALPGGAAWKALVPVRRSLPCGLDVPQADKARVQCEGFYYPHGWVLAVTIPFTWATPPELYDAVDVMRGVVTGATKVKVSWPGQPAPRSMPMDAFATEALTWLRETALGSGAAAGVAFGRPYSVVTFVALQDVNAAAATKDQDDVHRALEAVTRWLPDWKLNTLPPLDDRRAIIRSAPPSHVCYVTSAGLAVWFPAPATNPQRQRTLSCYHRNQVCATLQIESIDEMIKAVDDLTTNGTARSPFADQCAKLGAGIVGRLYGGTEDTYRSGSSRCHIDRRGFAAAVNRTRARYNWPALHSDQTPVVNTPTQSPHPPAPKP